MSWRAPTLADADAVVDLVVACDVHDLGDPDYTRADLLEEWAEEGVDLARDAWLADGAYGLLLGTDARAWVHPAHRGRGLGAALAARLEARARERGLPVLKQQLGARDDPGRALLQARGYTLAHRYADLALDRAGVAALGRPGAPSAGGADATTGTGAPDPAVPPPVAVRAARAGEETTVHDLIAAEFARGDGGRVDALATILAREPDLGLWLVAEAGGGDLAGALRAELRDGRGYIAEIATRPEHRGRGVATALIAAAARALVDRGAADVHLHVRSSNPGALRLYERLGFRGGWIVQELWLALR